MPQVRVKALPKSKASIYLARARNLLATMELATKEANPDGAATNAVQAAIALADAYTIHCREERCWGQDHLEVITLIARCSSPNKSKIGPLLSRILNRKSGVEYEDRAVTLKDADELVKWVRTLSQLVSADLGG